MKHKKMIVLQLKISTFDMQQISTTGFISKHEINNFFFLK